MKNNANNRPMPSVANQPEAKKTWTKPGLQKIEVATKINTASLLGFNLATPIHS
ncbi:hypothetical protein [Emticicia sp. TH156]|uniref:hypothetical protein n=1 Tax=Emticicia sp. TH156 TaxID=2067454 RepID=UPI001303F65B|nr:hypothetical protein [Emticicia sp. TH156]